MNKKAYVIGLISLLSLIVLTACSNSQDEPDNSGEQQTTETEATSSEHDGHEGMNHSSSGEVPDDLKEADNPKYEVGSKATIETDHMAGMNGAKATISGAYDTTVYTITYTPTNGGEKVEDHKWVIREELADVEQEPINAGSTATINASHMEGMVGATATITSAKETTVYMVDYQSTTDGEAVKNHKWVTEDELAPITK
ncbi:MULTISPECIES: YdhK family protein [Virgibacillus]|uniref:DUF1541 domain-containing protein n=1 Tax=Virgibacillus massiliensis TaxID=1462526 RepID=A0A024QG37_9BACI|nr:MULTISPECIES: YdhK family protein [Virgibacillus]EQB37192.1 hypothetical protein M948_09935 [Virgibacillus sp. CM-4]CDQ41212.1 hypothetical protein BN990_03567 [Virgibacillus massiliensis]